jgi:putative transposase
MRTSMPSAKAVVFRLAAVAMQETKTTYSRNIYQSQMWKSNNRNTEKLEENLTHF